MLLLLLIAGILTLLALRVPVAFALLIPSLVYIAVTPGVTYSLAFEKVSSGVNSFPLVAVPLFILAGYVANASGATGTLFDFISIMLSRVRARLAYVNIYTSLGFSWISGTATADVAGLGVLIMPQMRARGYPDRYVLGLTAASATIGPVMPPSVAAIIYGVTAGVSIGAMFAAGIIPALIIAVVLTIWVAVWAYRNPDIAVADKVNGDGFFRTAISSLPLLVAPVIIIGGILGGVFTPTEAAGVAVLWLLFVGIVIKRTMPPRVLWDVFLKAAHTTSTLFIIVATTKLLAWILAREQAPQVVAETLLNLTSNQILLILLINVGLLLVGMILDTISGILIMVPVLLPIAELIGLDPVQMGVMVIFNLAIGSLTPPIGLVLYILSSVTDTPFVPVVRAVAPMIVPLLIVLILISLIPMLTLWLPSLLGLI